MKVFRALLFLALITATFNPIIAQQTRFNYDSAWKSIDQLVDNKGLPKSALKEVDKIYERSKKEGNSAQTIKALLYQLNLGDQTEEDDMQRTVSRLRNEVAITAQPSKSILYSILATKFQNYLGNNRYRLYDRTQSAGPRTADPATWSLQDLHSEIDSLYAASLTDAALLQKTSLSTFDPILTKGNTRALRPTLYDLLANRALEYYSAGERDTRQVTNDFELSDEKAFAAAPTFAKTIFKTADSGSSRFKAILLYQQLLAFHLSDGNKAALVDADISRLHFVKQWSGLAERNQLFKKAIDDIIQQYGKDSVASRAHYELANYYYELANDENRRKDPEWPTALNKSLSICDAIITAYPNSEGGVNCYNLSQQIIQREITLSTETVNVPGEPFRAKVNFRNIDKLNLRIINYDSATEAKLEPKYENRFWSKLVALKPFKAWQQKMPANSDYREHSVEIKVDGLAPGRYLLVGSMDDDFGLKENPMAVAVFSVSNISFVSRGRDYYVLHRSTGKPLDNARIVIWTRVYDEALRNFKFAKNQTLQSDKNGFFQIKSTGNDNINYRPEFFWQNDHFFANEVYSSYYRPEQPDEKNAEKYENDQGKIFLFTDRSIYRPGQTVYFKGIGITRDFKTRKSKLWQTNDTILVALKDANDDQVDSVQLVQNEFGSFQGHFRIPQVTLTGTFRLVADYLDEVEIRVEEYKRPKFYVDYQKPVGTLKLDQEISVTGFAKAYAGNAIDGAKVTYRVTRNNRMENPFKFDERIFPRGASAEIAHGEGVTAADGTFKVSFKTKPDRTIDSALNPLFNYTISADITDLNGETRSADYTISLGYKALMVQVRWPAEEPVSSDSLKKLSIYTQNIAGEFQPAKLDLKIYQLAAPQRLIRKRLWPAPDQFVMNEAEFIRFFPHDEYKTETDVTTWNKTSQVYSDSFVSKLSGDYQLKNSALKQGWYLIQINTVDSFGTPVETTRYFQVYEQNNTLPSNTYDWHTWTPTSAEPGNTVAFICGTSAPDIFVIREKITGQDAQLKSEYSYYTLNREKRNFAFPITENDRGGFAINEFFVKDNRVYTNNWIVNVPWTNKALNINYATFRDKVEPGSVEKWNLKISGYQQSKVVAETLISMYDASLDQFAVHNWRLDGIWPTLGPVPTWSGYDNFSPVQSLPRYVPFPQKQRAKEYDELAYLNQYQLRDRMYKRMAAPASPSGIVANNEAIADSAAGKLEGEVAGLSVNNLQDVVVTAYSNTTSGTKPVQSPAVNIRKNFNETAFFFPDLKTDAEGNVAFSFTMPEALTQWKLMTLAHTKDLSIGYAQKMVVTQKQLMVQPNAPRFLRNGDTIGFSAKVVNGSTNTLNGQAQLELFDAVTNQSVDALFNNNKSTQNFSVATGQSAPLQFVLQVPLNFTSALTYRIVAKAGNFSDGEENTIPVLSNRLMVTESIPLYMNGAGSKSIKFEKLLQSGSSTSLSNYALTVEYTANPAWYAVQSLPYLMEFPYECAEQTFSRFYANAIATAIANSNPGIKKVWEQWQRADTAALFSNLQKNEELKSILLEETPWVMAAKTEARQKQNLGLLFNLARMDNEAKASLLKLNEAQLSNGGFAWFKGGADNRYITQLIATGIGKLKKMNAIPGSKENDLADAMEEMAVKAIGYSAKRLTDEYNDLTRKKVTLTKNNLSAEAIQYLYMRSFFPEIKADKGSEKAVAYYLGQSKKYWLQQNRYLQGMIALALSRNGDEKTAKAILASLKENSLLNEELGRYWKENRPGFYWQQAPVETQSLLIEAFSEIAKDEKTVNELKTWLLKQKQTQHWSSTKATADACYALLLKGTQWISNTANIELSLNNTVVLSSNTASSDGLGYFKKTIEGNQVNAAMGNINLTVSATAKNSTPSWGAVYWQYFEDMDKITPAATPLSLVKKLYIEKNTDKGPVLSPVSAGQNLAVGDKIKIRIELRVDRDMEFVQLKDLRAASMEPMNVLSAYKWQGGLGYYESTRDVATNFFFDYLPKGTWVFEYPVFVTHSGHFNVGIATIQCMYAPEFSAHSDGLRLNVK